MDIYLPRKRNLPFREIPAQYPGDIPTIVMDCGTLDGQQFNELEHKVKEDAAARLKRQGGRFRAPLVVSITRLINKYTRKTVGYFVEQKRED